MPVVLQPQPTLKYTALDIIKDALIEINMIAPGETPDGETGQWAFRKLNYLIDVWQAMDFYVYAMQFQVFNLLANKQPYTIGPHEYTPDLDTGNQPRPVKIVGAATLLNTSGTLVDAPIINIRDAAWWQAQQTKQITTNIPTDLYYQADNPLGSCFFWPVPNATVQVRLEFWNALSSYNQINDPLAGPGGAKVLPQAYRSALMLTLAESMLPGAAREAHPVLIAAALAARAAVFGNNVKSPRMMTQDTGMPRTGQRTGAIGDFNWFTGGAPGGPPQ